MNETTLEMFEDELNAMSVDDIMWLFPNRIIIPNNKYRFGWTENKISYSNGPEDLISFNYKNDFKQALILMTKWLVEKQYINLTLLLKLKQGTKGLSTGSTMQEGSY